MKSIAGILFALCLCLASAAVAADSSVAGTWISGDGDGLIEVRVSGGTISGTILGSARDDADRSGVDDKNPDPALRDRPLIGLNLFTGFRYDGDGVWSGGFIYDPNSGKTYRCKITVVDEQTLKVRGFIGISLIGRTEYWKRQAD